MRKVLASFAIVGGLIGAGAAPVAATQPAMIELPGAACNQGTRNAHGHVAGPAHPHVPHSMRGICMTMPAARS